MELSDYTNMNIKHDPSINNLRVVIDPACPNSKPIRYPAKKDDVGYDLVCWIPEGELVVKPGDIKNIATGVSIKLPQGCWGSIRSRSSTFSKRHLLAMHGTLDPGYVGPVFICVLNYTQEDVMIKNGDRLVQLVLIPTFYAQMELVEHLPDTERGDTGFGSSGL